MPQIPLYRVSSPLQVSVIVVEEVDDLKLRGELVCRRISQPTDCLHYLHCLHAYYIFGMG